MMLDGACGKKQVWHPMFEPEVFRKQMYCIEESTCDNVGTFGTPIVIWRPGHFAPLAPTRYIPDADKLQAAKHLTNDGRKISSKPIMIGDVMLTV